MAFEHLEGSFRKDKDISSYLEVFEDLKEPTRTVLGYTLDMASYLRSQGLSEDYLVFGGYAVLSHLMSELGEEVARVWRGSNDLDMVGDERVLRAIKRGYDVQSDLPSPNIANKRTLKLIVDHENECKVDFSERTLQNRLLEPEVNRHFGVDLRVASPLSLVRSKLYTPYEESLHSVDILKMLAVLERRGYSPEQIVGFFKPEQRVDLLKRIRKGNALTSGDRLGISPSGRFTGNVEEILKRLRPIH